MAVLNDIPGWKIEVNFDARLDQFTLHVEDVNFKKLNFKATVQPLGPQNIQYGKLKVNDVVINPEENDNGGFTPYNGETFVSLCQE